MGRNWELISRSAHSGFESDSEGGVIGHSTEVQGLWVIQSSSGTKQPKKTPARARAESSIEDVASVASAVIVSWGPLPELNHLVDGMGKKARGNWRLSRIGGDIPISARRRIRLSDRIRRLQIEIAKQEGCAEQRVPAGSGTIIFKGSTETTHLGNGYLKIMHAVNTYFMHGDRFDCDGGSTSLTVNSMDDAFL